MTITRVWIMAPCAALVLAGVVAPIAASPAVRAGTTEATVASSWRTDYAYAQKKTRDDQSEARKEMKAGNQLSLREIERRVLPKMEGAKYLGPAYDAAAHAYRLKFIKEGRVMYVDVDARTGQIINRSR